MADDRLILSQLSDYLFITRDGCIFNSRHS